MSCTLNPRLSPELLVSLAEVHAQSFASSWSVEILRQTVEVPFRHLVIIEQNDQLVGFLIFQAVADIAELITIAVAQNTRCQGLGKRLIDAMGTACLALSINQALLEVDENNKGAICFYEKLSAVKIFTRKDYYHLENNQKSDAYIYKLIFPLD